MAQKSILVVEDKPADVRLVMEALKKTGAHADVSVAGNGEDAIDFLLKKGRYRNAPKPDLILLDLKLPKKSGHEVIKMVRENKTTSNIPIVVFSNSDAPSDVNKAYTNRANCYLTKPLSIEEFIEMIKNIETFWLNDAKLPQK